MGVFAPKLNNYQTKNSNTFASVLGSPLKVQYGWGQINGTGATTVAETVTFPEAFTTVLGVSLTCLGAKVGSDATSITDLTASWGVAATLANANSITTSGFSAMLAKNDSTAIAVGTRAGYSWVAWGI